MKPALIAGFMIITAEREGNERKPTHLLINYLKAANFRLHELRYLEIMFLRVIKSFIKINEIMQKIFPVSENLYAIFSNNENDTAEYEVLKINSFNG
jgi:hypothetical protein